MRDIKFRAWDKRYCVMLPATKINFKKKWLMHFNKKTNIKLFVDFKDAILMQYIGLKDRNGQKIYEGDILQIVYEGEEEPEIYFGIVNYNPDKLSYQLFTKKNYYFMDEFETTNIKIIGNIHKNPELLEDN